ncbi:MAG: hypothetical protein GKS06_07850 [Acidobacteria bacterium]|nr:hypothetical protein [Acidobacteriota bacterium]
MRRIALWILLTVLVAHADAAHAQVYDKEPPDSQIVAGRRAAEAVQQDLDELLSRYPEAREFRYPGRVSFGMAHPDAPLETRQFGQLAGLWYVEQHSFFQGEWYCCWNAAWAWRYVIDGFGVQDLWVQHRTDLPPTSEIDRTFALTQLRVFRSDTEDWFVAYITGAGVGGGRNNGLFTARQVGDEIVMTREEDPGYEGPTDRIVFFGIERDRWLWRRDVQNEAGEWQTTEFIEAHRVPWSRE